ncbi:hypothetical protein MTR_5g062120 [Medicago truncatula]|uniref:Uncharacterized protein n=1 Tax=Medicago truncatula TaxID=3880 RepID=G7KA47_MEDTR|nr:hypothetical protein MTR_5g062120 [Medicago truncatula]
MSDGADIPSVNFSDPHYYDGLLKRRKTRQKVVCYGILSLLRRKKAVAKSEFSSSVRRRLIDDQIRIRNEQVAIENRQTECPTTETSTTTTGN